MSRGNASRIGEAPGLGPAGEPVLRWRFRIGDGPTNNWTAPPVPLVDDTIVVSDARGTLHAVDTETGAERWRFRTDATAADTSVVPHLPFGAGLVYVTGPAGLSALEAASGTERWRFSPVGGDGSWRLHAADAAVYVGGRHGLHALDAATGAVRWRFVPDGSHPVRSSYSPATAAFVLVDAAGGGVSAVHPASGRLRWRSQIPAHFSAEPEVAGGVILVGRDEDGSNLLALDLATGAERWRAEDWPTWISDIKVAGDLVCVGLGDGHVYALDAATGAERWRYRAGPHAASIWPAGTVLYVDSSDEIAADSAVAALDAASGAQRWRFGGFSGDVIDLRRLDGAVVIELHQGDADVYSIDDANGAERWRFEADFDPASRTIPAWRVRTGDAIVASSGRPRGSVRRFLGLRRRPGDAIEARSNRTREGRAVADGRALYLRTFTGDGLVAVDALTGAEAWRVRSAGFPITDPLLRGGALFFVGRIGRRLDARAVALYAYSVGSA